MKTILTSILCSFSILLAAQGDHQFTSDSISAAALHSATQLSDLFGELPEAFTITRYTIFHIQDGIDPRLETNRQTVFSKETVDMLKRAKSGDKVFIEKVYGVRGASGDGLEVSLPRKVILVK